MKNKGLKVLTILIIISFIIVLIAGIIYLKIKKERLLNSDSITSINKDWNRMKATYLAQRVLLSPTTSTIDSLSSFKDSKSAVDSLFNNPSESDVAKFQSSITDFTNNQKSKYKTQGEFEAALYTYKLVHDPDKSRQNLFHLWENIFSVDSPDKAKFITSEDGVLLSNLLYTNAYGNYIDLVEKVRTNYAMTSYLDLIYSPKNNPNENFSRELLQLFLMGQYTPLDTSNITKNYSDEDVNALSFILTGYRETKGGVDHSVTFYPDYHYSEPKLFLGENYNDPQNVVKYIIGKKKKEISLFLADKILRYYVSDSPDQVDLSYAANIILNNNFEILPSLKQILSSDFLYKDKYINELRYKNPLQLVASAYNRLYPEDYSIYPNPSYLTSLDFKPYNPGSVFGREGFNSNNLFQSGTIMNRWISNSLGIVNISKVAQDLILENLKSKINSPDALISILEEKIYLDKTLPDGVKADLIKYLTQDSQGNSVSFEPFNSKYQSNELTGLINIMLTQPEFTMISGFNQKAEPNIKNESDVTNGNKLILVRIKGGWDWQELLANLNDPSYKLNRGNFALNSDNSIALGQGYSLNKAASSLLPLINSKEAFFINSVGLPNHSRAHDIASIQMETGGDMQKGIVGKLFTNTLASDDLISITNQAPKIFNGSQSLQISSNNLSLYGKNSKENSTQNYKIDILKAILNKREFPSNIGVYYSQVLLLDKLSMKNIALGGTGGPGGQNLTQLPFVEELIQDGIGKIFYLNADKSYDTHANEQPLFDNSIESLVNNVTKFYNDVKGKSKVTIVFYSEFGRTNKINGGNGTDHGVGGGMIVISNSFKLSTITGTITPSKDTHNWNEVQVDERDVWDTIFKNIYNTPIDKLYGRNQSLDNYPKVL